MEVAADTQFMRKVNSAAVLSTIRERPPMSVSALASSVGLSRQAVSRSLVLLEDLGLVSFSSLDLSENRAGRPAQLVQFRAEAGYVVGVGISPQEVRVGVADLSGKVVSSERTSLRGTTVGSVLFDSIDRALAAASITRVDVWFASVGIPGVIDPDVGVIRLIPSMPELVGGSLAQSLQDHLGCSVYLDNDIKLATHGERSDAVGDIEQSFVFIHWGERVGAGIVLNGRLHRGASNDAGDIGFLDLVVGPAGWRAGNRLNGLGCFESWVGAAELVRLADDRAHSRDDIDLIQKIAGADDAFQEVLRAGVGGNAAVRDAVAEVARRFAVGIVAIRAILDPASIVIGGPMAQLGDVLLNPLRARLANEPLNQPRVDVSSLGDDAVLEGAIRHSLLEIEKVNYQLPLRQ